MWRVLRSANLFSVNAIPQTWGILLQDVFKNEKGHTAALKEYLLSSLQKSDCRSLTYFGYLSFFFWRSITTKISPLWHYLHPYKKIHFSFVLFSSIKYGIWNLQTQKGRNNNKKRKSDIFVLVLL